MKVCQVVPRYPPRTGGVETHVREISERLVERDHDVLVLTADAGSKVSTSETRNGVDVRRHRGVAPGGAFHVAPGIAGAVRRADAEVVHAHNYHSLPVLFAAVGQRGTAGSRFVVTPHYHGGSANRVRDAMLSLYRPAGSWALGRADAVVAVSEWERDRLREDFGLDAAVVPNGLNVERFTDVDPYERQRRYLLTVGRLEEYKGVGHAIRALPEIEAYDLLVAGTGPYRDDLERIADRTGVHDRVEFLGYVDDERLPALYAGADAYLSLSAFEAYGMTVAEALTTGTPCVVRRCGALEDWVDVTGVVGVEDAAPATVASAVRRATALDPPDWRAPSWDDAVDQLLAIYRR